MTSRYPDLLLSATMLGKNDKGRFIHGNRYGNGRPRGSRNRPPVLTEKPAVRLRELMSRMTSDLGGAENLTEAERQLIKRAATISLTCEQMELRAASGEPFDLTAYSVATGHLGRTLKLLGLKRRPRDEAPSLRQYIDAQRQANGAFAVEEKDEAAGNS
jgi:hypothetical protein